MVLTYFFNNIKLNICAFESNEEQEIPCNSIYSLGTYISYFLLKIANGLEDKNKNEIELELKIAREIGDKKKIKEITSCGSEDKAVKDRIQEYIEFKIAHHLNDKIIENQDQRDLKLKSIFASNRKEEQSDLEELDQFDMELEIIIEKSELLEEKKKRKKFFHTLEGLNYINMMLINARVMLRKAWNVNHFLFIENKEETKQENKKELNEIITKIKIFNKKTEELKKKINEEMKILHALDIKLDLIEKVGEKSQIFIMNTDFKKKININNLLEEDHLLRCLAKEGEEIANRYYEIQTEVHYRIYDLFFGKENLNQIKNQSRKKISENFILVGLLYQKLKKNMSLVEKTVKIKKEEKKKVFLRLKEKIYKYNSINETISSDLNNLYFQNKLKKDLKIKECSFPICDPFNQFHLYSRVTEQKEAVEFLYNQININSRLKILLDENKTIYNELNPLNKNLK